MKVGIFMFEVLLVHVTDIADTLKQFFEKIMSLFSFVAGDDAADSVPSDEEILQDKLY